MAITAPINTIDRSNAYARSWTSPSALDRVIARIGVALITWASARASRKALSHEENLQQRQLRSMALQREVEALRLPQRIGF